jgi:DNA polymerase III alpha subunit
MVTDNPSLDGLFVEEMSDTIKQYNSLVPTDKQITVKTTVNDQRLDWGIPPEFLEMDIKQYVEDRLWDELEYHGWIGDGMTKDGVTRILRTKNELELYQQAGLTDVIRTLIYVINTLRINDVVWGVGRGSSVASYVLYLIGVHDVDSVEYGLDIKEFLRPG